MLVINTNARKVEVLVNTPQGPDYVHIQPKGRVHLNSDQKVDKNWLAQNGQGIRLVEDTSAATVQAQLAATTIASSKSSEDE